MMSRIFCCNPTILKKNLARYWPIMAICGFIAFMLLPMTISETDDYSVAWHLETIVSYLMPILIFGYAPLCAACVFGYLHKSRSSNMLHAFPVTRNSLFVSNLLSGLCMFLLPWLAVCLVTLFIFLSNGISLSMLLSVFAIGTLEFLFFFAVATFCMLLCGKTVYSILVYLFLNVGLALMELLVLTAIEPFLFGVATEYNMLSEYLPLIYMMMNPMWEVMNKLSVEISCNWGCLGILSGLALVFLALAWLLYRRRHMEHCGDPIAYPRIQPVVLVIVSLFASLALGLFITAITFPNGVSAENATGMHISLLIGGFIGFFGVEMLLRKTTRVFKKRTFLGYGIFAVALSLLMLCVRFDWLNIVGYVPESNRVTIEYSKRYNSDPIQFVLTDAESIEAFREIHQSIVDHRNSLAEDNYSYDSYYHLRITYRLNNGEEIKREYYIRKASYNSTQREIYEAFEEFLYGAGPALSYIQSLTAAVASANDCRFLTKTIDFKKGKDFGKAQINMICEAMLLDAKEGNLGLPLLLSSSRDIGAVYVNGQFRYDFTFDFTKYYNGGYLLRPHDDHSPRNESCDCFRTLYIPESATHTYTLLTELIKVMTM